MEDGGIPQLVKKGKGKKRPGYRGDDAARSDRASGRSAGRADPGGSVDRGGGSSNRERGITQQYTGPKGTTGRIDRPGADPKPPQEFIGGVAYDVTSDPKKRTDNIQSLADQVEKLDSLNKRLALQEDNIKSLIFLLDLQATEYCQSFSLDLM